MKGGQGGTIIDVASIIKNLELHPGMRVADFGCGTSGYYLIPTSKEVGDNGIVYAVDVQPGVLEGVKGLVKQKGLSNVQTVWSDLETPGATKIEEKSLDRAYIITVLFQIKKDFEVLKEIARLLKDGGLLMVVDWRKELCLHIGPPEEMRLAKDEITKMAGRLNLEFKKEFNPGQCHYGLIYQKII